MHVSMMIFSLGVVLFVVWAARELDKKKLKKLVIALLAIGLIGGIASCLMLKNQDLDWKDEDGFFMGRHYEQKYTDVEDDSEDAPSNAEATAEVNL